MNTETITIQFTVAEANWLVAKLERIAAECRAKAARDLFNISLRADQIWADMLVDRLTRILTDR
jgi:hypothetical protein